MANTYKDNYSFTDTIDTQSVSTTQYNSNEGAGVFNKDNYIPTSITTHTIPASVKSFATGAILFDGYSQKSLYELLLQILVNWNNAMSSLDDDGGVDTTTFFSGCGFGTLGEDVLGGTYNISPNGIGTAELATFLQAIVTKFAACTALLDADGTLTDENYASTLDITFSAKTGWVPPLTTTTAFDITNPASKIKKTGIDQEALVDFLNTVITNMNALWAKLDADI